MKDPKKRNAEKFEGCQCKRQYQTIQPKQKNKKGQHFLYPGKHVNQAGTLNGHSVIGASNEEIGHPQVYIFFDGEMDKVRSHSRWLYKCLAKILFRNQLKKFE